MFKTTSNQAQILKTKIAIIFYFLQNVFERIDGSIQNFVSSDGFWLCS